MQTSCTQCGECCRKGGPALHIEDKFLIMQGKLPASGLFTLRKGEVGMDPVENKKIILEEEIIKIQPDSNRDWACIHLSEKGDACEVYDTRPLEIERKIIEGDMDAAMPMLPEMEKQAASLLELFKI
ncbi:putative zinc- or iron-chelating protein [Desulfobotulus alkaliphilus]|uniref:Putative zinc-or iron-chelating protein n=1 Tax=Desulfobotulus alkaliphilus TaxID=622671 RepID=A0A562R7T3_9BACT|nr:YkgJ family cysteine cluster protein [Desulfobotulus alkaliphilus]TWI64614.1 putative zinc- or iron-chelating protein [Desulfobotulus alkaliphilus]